MLPLSIFKNRIYNRKNLVKKDLIFSSLLKRGFLYILLIIINLITTHFINRFIHAYSALRRVIISLEISKPLTNLIKLKIVSVASANMNTLNSLHVLDLTVISLNLVLIRI